MRRAVSAYLARIGRKGGKKGGPKGGAERARRLTAERRREIARLAAEARWGRDGRCRARAKRLRCTLASGHASPCTFT